MRAFRPVAPNLPLLFTVVAWAYNFNAVKMVFQEINPAAVSLTRAVAIFVLMILVCRVMKLPFQYPEGTKWKLLFQGFLSYGLYMICFLVGMNYTTPSMGAIIMATSPVLTGLAAMAIKQEPFRWSALLGSGVAFGGVVLAEMDRSNGSGTLLGNGLIFAGACIWVVALLILKPMLSETGPIRALLLALPGAFLALVPFGWSATVSTDWTAVSPMGWVNFMHVALISSGLAFIMYYKGMEQIGIVRGTMYQFLVPPCTALMAWALTGVAPGWIFWLGLVCVLVGVRIGAAPAPGPDLNPVASDPQSSTA